MATATEAKRQRRQQQPQQQQKRISNEKWQKKVIENIANGCWIGDTFSRKTTEIVDMLFRWIRNVLLNTTAFPFLPSHRRFLGRAYFNLFGVLPWKMPTEWMKKRTTYYTFIWISENTVIFSIVVFYVFLLIIIGYYTQEIWDGCFGNFNKIVRLALTFKSLLDMRNLYPHPFPR